MDAFVLLVGQQKFIATHVPGYVARLGHDLLVSWSYHKALLGFLEVAFVLERQALAPTALHLNCEFRGRLALRIEMFARISGDDLAAAGSKSGAIYHRWQKGKSRSSHR